VNAASVYTGPGVEIDSIQLLDDVLNLVRDELHRGIQLQDLYRRLELAVPSDDVGPRAQGRRDV
jgi:hypothetical protein